MNLTFNTQIVDVSVALKALQHYRQGEFQQAISVLLDVLDNEPLNWQARLMLAVCYYKTNQFLASQRAFRLIYEQANDLEIRKKGLEGLQATKAKLEKKMLLECPEFNSYAERSMPELVVPWLEFHAQPAPASLRPWRPSYNR
jgi:hypothetical protein